MTGTGGRASTQPSIRWTDDGWEMEPDQRHVDIMVKEGFDQLPVITQSGKIVGVATMGSLKAKLVKVEN